MKKVFVFVLTLPLTLALTSCGGGSNDPISSSLVKAWNPKTASEALSGVGRVDNGDDGCAGTLVAPRAVLTAAHCLRRGRLRFWLKENQFASVSTYAVHPDYTWHSDEPGMDVALLFLASTDYGAVAPGYLPFGGDDGLAEGASLLAREARAVAFDGFADIRLPGKGLVVNGLIQTRGGQNDFAAGDGHPLVGAASGSLALLGINAWGGNYIYAGAFRTWVRSQLER